MVSYAALLSSFIIIIMKCFFFFNSPRTSTLSWPERDMATDWIITRESNNSNNNNYYYYCYNVIILLGVYVMKPIKSKRWLNLRWVIIILGRYFGQLSLIRWCRISVVVGHTLYKWIQSCLWLLILYLLRDQWLLVSMFYS